MVTPKSTVTHTVGFYNQALYIPRKRRAANEPTCCDDHSDHHNLCHRHQDATEREEGERRESGIQADAHYIVVISQIVRSGHSLLILV